MRAPRGGGAARQRREDAVGEAHRGRVVDVGGDPRPLREAAEVGARRRGRVHRPHEGHPVGRRLRQRGRLPAGVARLAGDVARRLAGEGRVRGGPSRSVAREGDPERDPVPGEVGPGAALGVEAPGVARGVRIRGEAQRVAERREPRGDGEREGAARRREAPLLRPARAAVVGESAASPCRRRCPRPRSRRGGRACRCPSR